MSGAPQIHIFFGAPILSNSLKASKEEKFSTATSETWSKLHFSFTKDTFNLCTRKCMCPEQADHRTLNNVVLAAHSKDHCTTNLEKRCVLADVFLTDCADHGRSVKSFSDDAKGASELTENCCHVCRDTRTENKVKHFACQQLPTDVQTSEPHSKESEDVKGGITCMSHAHLGISALILSTKNRGLKSLEQDDKLSKSQHSCHKLINQYLEIHHPQITESKTEKPLDVCSSLAISANTEFLGILTSSQVALLSGRHAVDQNEMHNQSMKLREAELDDPYKEDVIIYENRWVGEKMLQSTYTSRLLNLGSFSAINQNEFSHLVDVNILQDLLIYVSSKHNYLQALPKRQPQTLNNIQYVLLDQLKPDTLVHSIVKIVNITELTESTYSYKGEKQRKIILIIEQVKDQHYALVLWGAAAAYSPNLQKKRDHIWEFKYLFAKHNPVSGELELHTTPWTTFECLFEDDRRAVAFKERFKKSVKSLMRGTSLAAHLEEKCSGTIQVRAHVSELKFTSYGQLIFDHNTSLQCIFASLSLITYTGCAKCGLELQTDENKIYEQCSSCLPSNKVKMFYRPALMTVEDDGCEISVRVVSELMEKMFLNIPADWLNKTIEPSLDTTYGMIVAELCHSLVTDVKASYLLEIKSHFVLDENSYPLEKDFHLLGFHLDL
ncbi:shieldin complex subunit 2 isoform X3 [Tiliqua scincoides]|uniref:shieldin complex subunit 2 isoform X3 n=1 Tax=Tiliqua scincoides TaxID=71010 RepID=UPI0034631689